MKFANTKNKTIYALRNINLYFFYITFYIINNYFVHFIKNKRSQLHPLNDCVHI